MFFDDLFYPGNPKKRAEVAQLRYDITQSFIQYKNSWNDNANLLNRAFLESKDVKYSKIQLPVLKKDINVDTSGDCINEINNAIKDTNVKLNKLIKDIGLEELLPTDWAEKGIDINTIGESKLLEMGKILSAALSIGIAGYIGYYTITGITVATALVSMAAGVATGLEGILGGVFVGAVLGGVAFVITDIISSAITGAIERKQLRETIDALRDVYKKVEPLRNATPKLIAVTNQIRDGKYSLDATHDLCHDDEGFYIINTGRPKRTGANKICRLQVPSYELPERLLFIPA